MTSTRDVRDRCRPSAESTFGCDRCEDVSPAGGSGSRLLLAPQDRNAGRALERALDSAGIVFECKGPVYVLPYAGRDGELHRKLKARMSDLLQTRVKGVFADEIGPPEKLLDAFIQAEPLSILFNNLDVEWARQVLAEDRLFSVYQPIVHASTGDVFAYEALVRGRLPHTDEIVGAGRLIYACERLNLHHVLDQKARVAAIRGSAALGLDLSDSKLFVNFLPNTIYEPEVCLRATLDAADANSVPLDRIVFEVTEAERVPDVQQLRRIVQYYRSRGAGISLDDISSGFASVQYLADLVPDYAKIDRLLIHSAVSSSSARHTLDSIVNLAGKLGVTVVGEGIETLDEMRLCVNAGIELLQGFLFAHPATSPERVSSAPFKALAA